MEPVEALTDYLSKAAGALERLFTAEGSFLSPVPMLVALLIAAGVIAFREHRGGRRFSVQRVLKRLFPKRILSHPSARRDLAIIMINDGLLFFLPAAGAATVGVLVAVIVETTGSATLFGNEPRDGALMFALFGIYYMLVWDFFATFAHYLKHKVPLLWEFHKVHHCAEVLTPLTAMRRHPIEILISGLITGAGISLAIIVWVLLFGAPGDTWKIGGLTVGVYLWRLLGYNIRHSHLWISYGPFWNNILVSPAHHQLHHSRDQKHYDCNFGHIFSFWDRLFGTLYHPVKGERIEFGIERDENEKLNSLAALYIRPIVQAGKRLTAKPAPNNTPPHPAPAE